MQSKMLNIPSYIDDPSYRYKMPSLQLKTEGICNSIKTKILNLNEVATHLRVPLAYPLKFVGSEVGSQTNERLSFICGSFPEPELRKLLDKFIEKYVLCPNCWYPDMVLKINQGRVGGACNSCGTRSVLDNTHRLAAYIIKNPPKNVPELSGDKKPVDEKETKGDKKEDEIKPGETSGHEVKPHGYTHEGNPVEKQETEKKEEGKNEGKENESVIE